MRKALGLLIAVLVGASSAAFGATLSDSNIDLRTTLYVMNFSDLAFSGAVNQRSDVLSFHGAVGDSGTFGIVGFSAGYAGVTVVPSAAMSVTNLQPANSSGTVIYTAGITGTSNLTLTQSWLNTGTLTHGVSAGGLNTLDFFARNANFLRTGGTFDFTVYIPGHWTSGTATNQFQFIGLNPEFSIVKNFVYDSANNRTVFEAVDTNYTQLTSDVHFVLYGSAVPEPASWLMLFFGLGVLIVRRRLVALSAMTH